MHLANDVGQSFAAHVFAFNGFVGHAIGDDEEDFRQIGVVWSEDDGIVALKKTKNNELFENPSHQRCWGRSLSKTREIAQHGYRKANYLSMRSHRKSNV